MKARAMQKNMLPVLMINKLNTADTADLAMKAAYPLIKY